MNRARRKSEVDALFLSPHPDDVELFCGGTVARLVEAGSEVAIVDLTRGEMSSNGTVEERREASLRAAEILGVKEEREVLGFPDGGVKEHDAQQLKVLVELLRVRRPQLLFAPYGVDRHPDHVAAGALARRAIFFAGLSRFAAGGSLTGRGYSSAIPVTLSFPFRSQWTLVESWKRAVRPSRNIAINFRLDPTPRRPTSIGPTS